jgi:hypothetical protein
MSSTLPPSLGPALVFLVLIVLIIVRRTVLMIQGAQYSAPRLFAFAGIYILLFAALAFGTLYAAAATWGASAYALVALYVAIPVAAATIAAPYVARIVRFEQRGNGVWYYRLSWHVPVLYLVLFIARIVAEIVIFGLNEILVSFPPPTPSTVTALVVLIVVDLLFGVSLGLLIGRGLGVLRAHRDLLARAGVPPPPPSPPLPSG